MSNKKWQVLNSKYKLKNRYLKVRLDVCKDLSGNKIDYYVIERPNSVGIVALTPEKKVVLQRQYRHPHQKWVVQIPAGVIENGESTRETVKRELLEESGYKVSNLIKLNDYYPAVAKFNSTWTLYLGLNADKVSQPKFDPSGEKIETLLVDFEAAVKMVQAGEIEDMDSALAILNAKEYLSTYPITWAEPKKVMLSKKPVDRENNLPVRAGLFNRYVVPI